MSVERKRYNRRPLATYIASPTTAGRESDSEFTLCRKRKKLAEIATDQGSAAAVGAPEMTLVAVRPCRTGSDPGYVTELD